MPNPPPGKKVLLYPIRGCVGLFQHHMILRKIKEKGRQHDSRCKLVRGVIGVDGINK